MEGLNRRPFQGVTNIIRFNRHFYIIAIVLTAGFFFFKRYLPDNLNIVATLIVLMTISATVVSLIVSYYIYDHSNLYSLNWLNNLNIKADSQLVNINAGFDETSAILKQKYSRSNLTVFDFYDPQKHTEISIERARKAYPAFPGTKLISTTQVPLSANSVDHIFLILAAHEIRNINERIVFFTQLQKALRPDGKIIVLEHQRDTLNFIAYNFGYLHFFSKKTWKLTFTSAGLTEIDEIKITPFISSFTLQKNGTTT